MESSDAIEVEFREIVDTSTGELVPVPVDLPRGKRKGGMSFGKTYPEWVEETYFRAWVANLRRSGAGFRAFVKENWEQFSPDGAAFFEVPLPTINGWIRNHKWHDKATTNIAANFPDHHFRDTARLIELGSEALELLGDVVKGNIDAPARDRVKAAETILLARGLGTLGSVNRTMPTIRARTTTLVEMREKTPEELTEIRQKALRDGRTDMEERKR